MTADLAAQLAAIRARHAAATAWFAVSDSQPEEQQAHADRAALLALVAALEAGAQRLRDGVPAIIRDWLTAYPEDIFPPLADGEAQAAYALLPGFSDRVAAQMGRHMARELLKQVAALAAAPPAPAP